MCADQPHELNIEPAPLDHLARLRELLVDDAAALLDKRMRGYRPRQRRITLHPRRVIARRSTDILAVNDGDVAQALKLIHHHNGPSLTVADITQAIPLSP